MSGVLVSWYALYFSTLRSHCFDIFILCTCIFILYELFINLHSLRKEALPVFYSELLHFLRKGLAVTKNALEEVRSRHGQIDLGQRHGSLEVAWEMWWKVFSPYSSNSIVSNAFSFSTSPEKTCTHTKWDQLQRKSHKVLFSPLPMSDTGSDLGPILPKP